MCPKVKKHKLSFSTLPAFTVAELLIVMLVAGIVFLMAFEGLNIVRQYSNLINRKLMEKTTLLYGHQVLEVLMEQSDSIRKSDQGVIFYSDALDSMENYLVIDSANISLYRGKTIDILFPNPVHVNYRFLNERTGLIDSIFIAVKSGRDTLQFEYGLSSLHGIKLNIFSE
jgi:competence protein ComGC